MKEILMKYDEVKFVMTQTGRPNDGTDPTGFFNIEFNIQLKPENEWKKKISKEELLEEMRGLLKNIRESISDSASRYRIM
jgi:cobalt-zinc-cadmium resistance protein CzcA